MLGCVRACHSRSSALLHVRASILACTQSQSHARALPITFQPPARPPCQFHFLPGEPLHPLKDELLLWASCRGQLLARTVRGMMSYRAALAALAEHENPQLSSSGAAGTAAGAGGGGAEQQQALSPGQAAALRQVVLGDLVDAKYSYVVSSQVRLRIAAHRCAHVCCQSCGRSCTVHARCAHGCTPCIRVRMCRRALRVKPCAQCSCWRQPAFDARIASLVLASLTPACLHTAVAPACLRPAAQNLGEFASKAGSDLRAGWLVHSLRLLRRRYPTLKVAFIDKQPLVTASRPGHRVELRRDCSVLLATARQQALDAATGAGVRGRQQQQQPDYEAYRCVMLAVDARARARGGLHLACERLVR